MVKVRTRINSILNMLIVVLLLGGSSTLSSCSGEDDLKEDLVETKDNSTTREEAPNAGLTGNGQQPQGDVVEYRTDDFSYGEARIVKKVVYSTYSGLTNYNFIYPSKDPFGNPIMLSGTITMGDEMSPDVMGRGLVLYNHYTVNKATECPWEGDLLMQNMLLKWMLPSSRLIVISADYYGFGVTADKNQAYCLGSNNARASVDALIAARQLLKQEGFQWDENELLNVGYSQGGQTAMAVVKLLTEEHPDIRITRTLAGGGPYDMVATYQNFVSTRQDDMPSTIIGVLLAFNEFYKLDNPRSSMFVEPTLSHIDEWVLSKQYGSLEIDALVDTTDLNAIITPPLFDLNSDISRGLTEALDKENLCKGWTPRKDENILLIHHLKDGIVPVVNAEHLYAFLKEQGVENVEMQTTNFGQYLYLLAPYARLFGLGDLVNSKGLLSHGGGALVFLSLSSTWLREHYGYTDIKEITI